jgi:hypothetical protein
MSRLAKDLALAAAVLLIVTITRPGPVSVPPQPPPVTTIDPHYLSDDIWIYR